MAEDIATVGQAKGVSVIGYSIVASVADDRQITFQHFVPRDMSDEDANRDLDRIMRLVDRQKAIYEMPKLVEELQALTDQISQGAEDLTNVDVRHEKAVAGLKLQIESLEAEKKRLTERAYAEHTSSGRRGEFAPKGSTAVQIGRLETDIDKLRGEIEEAGVEKSVHAQSFKASQQRRRDRIAILQEKIAERRALGGG